MGLVASGQLLAALRQPGLVPPDVWVVERAGDGGRVQVTEAPTDPSQGSEKWGLCLA